MLLEVIQQNGCPLKYTHDAIKKDEELTNNYDLINKKFPFIGGSKEGYQTC